MRMSTAARLAVPIVVGVCLITVVSLLIRSQAGNKTTRTTQKSAVRESDEGGPSQVDWPMLGGGQGHLGRASGMLPDSLGLLWKFKTGGAVKSSPAIADSLVFVGSSDGNIYAINQARGKKVWLYKTGDAVDAAPCVVDGTVFAGSTDGFLYAVNARSGVLKWKYETQGQISGGANWVRSPDGQAMWILVGSYDNKLHCVDSETGGPVYSYETGNYVNGSPAVGNNEVVFGGCDARIHVLSAVDGSKLQEIDSGSYIAGSAVLFEGHVYVGNYEGVFLKADIKTGEVVWKYSPGNAPFFSSPAIGDDVVVFGGRDKLVHCVDRGDGKVRWTFRTGGDVDGSPVICGDKVVVGSEDGWLYMIRLSDGQGVWSYDVGESIMTGAALGGGMVVIGSDDGYVYAFGPKDRGGRL